MVLIELLSNKAEKPEGKFTTKFWYLVLTKWFTADKLRNNYLLFLVSIILTSFFGLTGFLGFNDRLGLIGFISANFIGRTYI